MITKTSMIALLGRPNVGKSTLLNRLVGEKVAIVSNKPQTTRGRICAVVKIDGVQLVLMDTPGFHKAHNKLGEHMQKAVRDSLADVDAAALVVEPVARIGKPEALLLERIKAAGTPCVLAVNKIDTVTHTALLPVLDVYSKAHDFVAIVPLSAKTGSGVDILGRELARLMPEGPQLFPDGMVTDQTDQVYAAELVREKLLWALEQEIPHGIACVVERWEQSEELLSIGITVICERDSHKAIVIGKNGSVLKKVGEQARAELEKFFGRKVFLETWVKVRPNWRNSEQQIRSYGLMTDE